jgi:citrate synthase
MIAAVAYRTAMGLPVVYPKREFSYTKNFLYMMYKDPMSDTFECDDFLVEALEKILILHADHEQNASTSTVRIAGSSLANPYACIAAGIASLWGPMHGGANEAVLDMLRRIGTPDKIDEFFSNVIHTKKERLMGFGHRVYKNMDPRNEPIKQIAHEMMSNPSIQVCNEELLDLAKEVEQRAL